MKPALEHLAERVVECCRTIALCTEEPGRTTRTFLSPPMHEVHRHLRAWAESLGMRVYVDAAGNLRALRGSSEARRLVIASHLDTVPDAGAFDGILGVVAGFALVEALADQRPELAIEVIGFSEEEGVRFATPFIGSMAVAGRLNPKPEVRDAIRAFGLDDTALPAARISPHAVAYFEIHIEQGPVLESLEVPLGVVDAIAGQSRFRVTFTGRANHAGTTPMNLRRDALTAAAEWILAVEDFARRTPGLVATTGKIRVAPGAGNVVPGVAELSLDIRHADDAVRYAAGKALTDWSTRPGVTFESIQTLDQTAVPMDASLIRVLEQSAGEAGHPVHRLVSGAGHDAMILASLLPSAMLFVRSPGGVSHHPDETVLVGDVCAALETGLRFITHV